LNSSLHRLSAFLILSLFACTTATADTPRIKEKNLISIEVLGRGGYGSIQYDRSITSRFALGVGFGGVTATTYSVVRSLTAVTSTKMEPWYTMFAQYYIAGEYLSPFLTGGLTYLPEGYSNEWTFWPGAGVEFRTHVGPTLRLTLYLPKLSPIGTIPGYPSIWLGLTLGYCF
jgi:hypothetical protein